MDYVDGTVASELRESMDFEFGPLGTPEQDRKFWQQVADIQVQLSAFEFDEIGSLFQKPNTSEFFIGLSPHITGGPWIFATEFYNDLADNELKQMR